jgi:histone acetyltransferase (RNA polymerase elongator complex component)
MKKNNEKCVGIREMEIGDLEFENLKSYLVVRKYKASEGIEYHLSIEAHEMNKIDFIKYYWFMFVSFLIWIFTGKWRYWSGNLETYIGLFGFLRLRFEPTPGGENGSIIPELVDCALIREVHVYGLSLGVGTNGNGSQHRGYGKFLMKNAENISRMNGYKKCAVIAGVGTREYYEKHCGYKLKGTYMLKNL